ncbi:hypothetical protein SDC9_101798 [bioreactor metagenome]|uniref:Uncharacterized protein n=1 Tax=bioreactor metagenome TaxID=1076179 RepID=A0A645AVT7_9ZZZZ
MSPAPQDFAVSGAKRIEMVVPRGNVNYAVPDQGPGLKARIGDFFPEQHLAGLKFDFVENSGRIPDIERAVRRRAVAGNRRGSPDLPTCFAGRGVKSENAVGDGPCRHHAFGTNRRRIDLPARGGAPEQLLRFPVHRLDRTVGSAEITTVAGHCRAGVNRRRIAPDEFNAVGRRRQGGRCRQRRGIRPACRIAALQPHAFLRRPAEDFFRINDLVGRNLDDAVTEVFVHGQRPAQDTGDAVVVEKPDPVPMPPDHHRNRMRLEDILNLAPVANAVGQRVVGEQHDRLVF